MGTVLRKSLPGQLSELRQQVVPGVPTPRKTFDKSTNLIIHPAMLCNTAMYAGVSTPDLLTHAPLMSPHSTTPRILYTTIETT